MYDIPGYVIAMIALHRMRVNIWNTNKISKVMPVIGGKTLVNGLSDVQNGCCGTDVTHPNAGVQSDITRTMRNLLYKSVCLVIVKLRLGKAVLLVASRGP